MKTADPTLLNDADFSVQVTPERVEKPTSRWRNKWRSLCDHEEACECGDPGHVAGTIYLNCCGPFESKDLAETIAAEQIEQDIADWGVPQDEYLGAVAEDDA